MFIIFNKLIEPNQICNGGFIFSQLVSKYRLNEDKTIDVTIISQCGEQLHVFTALPHIIMTIHLQLRAQYFGLH